MLDFMATVHDELDFDLVTADESLESATSSVAAAWAALRHAANSRPEMATLAKRMVDCLTVIRATKKLVVEAKLGNDPNIGRSPDDWYQMY